MNIFDFIKAAKALNTNEEVVALVDQFIAENGPGNLASLRNELDEIIGGTLIADDKVYLAHMGNFARQMKDVPVVQIPEDGGLGNVQFPARRMGEYYRDTIEDTVVLNLADMNIVKGRETRPGNFNADFEGITPGTDQLIYDAMNAKANAELEQGCMTSQCLTDKGHTALGESKYPFKLTDRHGDRGVICEVIPNYQLPLDKEGNRPEIVINDSPCFKLPTSLAGPRSIWNSMSGKEAPEGFNITIPALVDGDTYHRTHVTSDHGVLHIAHDKDDNQVFYVCTFNGNVIMREMIIKGIPENTRLKTYSSTVAGLEEPKR